MSGIINRNFSKSMVRSHIEYANVIWCPFKDYLIVDIERVPKRATKMVKGLRNLSYREKLIALQLSIKVSTSASTIVIKVSTIQR